MTVMGSKFVTCLAPGMKPCFVGMTLTPPTAFGEQVSIMFEHVNYADTGDL